MNYDICSDLAYATEKAKDRVFDNMVSLLEKYANEHFQSLIKYNDLAGGILKFEKSPSGSILFNYMDSNGNVVHGSSEGFQRNRTMYNFTSFTVFLLNEFKILNAIICNYIILS